MSDFNLNENELKKLMKNASSRSSIDIGKMKEAADSGKLDDFLNKNLSPDTEKSLDPYCPIKRLLKKCWGVKKRRRFYKNLKRNSLWII